MTLRFLAPAAAEVRATTWYYEDKVPGLGFDFISEVRAALRRILANPRAWAPLDDDFRRCRTARFPYGIIYRIEGENVLVVSVMHLHRFPDSWRKNL